MNGKLPLLSAKELINILNEIEISREEFINFLKENK